MSPTSEECTLNNLQVESVNEYDDTKSTQVVDENSNFTSEPTKNKNKRGTVSIDVTKALMLLGFSSWSTLEKGKGLKSCLYSIIWSNIKNKYNCD